MSNMVPASWKRYCIIPVLRPLGPPTDVAPYPPIALTSCVDKVMKRMVLPSLQWYLEHHDTNTNRITGFYSG